MLGANMRQTKTHVASQLDLPGQTPAGMRVLARGWGPYIFAFLSHFSITLATLVELSLCGAMFQEETNIGSAFWGMGPCATQSPKRSRGCLESKDSPFTVATWIDA